jgi:glycosyltransferase involved in cell wall biosynthesis
MRIAFVITRADSVGGASIHVRDLAAALVARQGYEVKVFLGGEAGPVTRQLSAREVPWQIVPSLGRSIHPLRDLAAIRQLTRELKSFRPDLVSTHTSKAGLIGRLAAKRTGIPAIYTPHGWTIGDRLSPAAGKVFKHVERFAARHTARIVNVCQAERQLALDHGVAKPALLAVIHNGVHDVPRQLLARPSIRTAQPVIATVARMEAPKDHATLLRALARIQDLNWRMRWAGDGPLEAVIRRQAGMLGLTPRIEFLGASTQVETLLAQSHLFVLSSRSEGFPRSILEALRAGLPVVASKVGGVGEAVSQGNNGFTLPSGDASGMAQSLRLLLESPDLRGRMGAASRARYESEFTFERMLNATLAVWRGALEPGADAEHEFQLEELTK